MSLLSLAELDFEAQFMDLLCLNICSNTHLYIIIYNNIIYLNATNTAICATSSMFSCRLGSIRGPET